MDCGYGLPVIGSCNYRAVITAVITGNYSPPFQLPVICNREPVAAPPSAREHTLRSLVPSAAPRAWQPCRRHRGQPLTDADGQVLKAGSTVVNSKFGGEGIARGTVPLEKDDGVTRANRRQQCWKATEPWHREPEAGVITAWLATACTCAWRSIREQYMAGSLAGLLTFSPTPRPACSKSSTRIIWADGSKKGCKGASKAQC